MIAVIAFSQKGMALGEKLTAYLQSAGEESRLSRGGKEGCSLAEWAAEAFSSADALVFVGAAGIAVRAIAPHVRAKTIDPAVVAIDELGRFVIPLLSGHIGGANALAARLASALGAQAVITTATDLNGVFAVDSWAVEKGLAIGHCENIKAVSSALLQGKTAWIESDFPLQGALAPGLKAGRGAPQICVSYREQPGLLLIPPVLALGIGCRRGVSADVLEEQIARWLKEAGFRIEAVCEVHTIDLKAEEAGLLEFCKRRGWRLFCHSAEELKRAEGAFTPSAFVKSVTGVENVCERAAALAGRLVLKKQSGNGMTLAASEKPFLLQTEGEKQ